jgi:hypothetical protein
MYPYKINTHWNLVISNSDTFKLFYWTASNKIWFIHNNFQFNLCRIIQIFQYFDCFSTTAVIYIICWATTQTVTFICKHLLLLCTWNSQGGGEIIQTVCIKGLQKCNNIQYCVWKETKLSERLCRFLSAKQVSCEQFSVGIYDTVITIFGTILKLKFGIEATWILTCF